MLLDFMDGKSLSEELTDGLDAYSNKHFLDEQWKEFYTWITKLLKV